MKTRVEIDPAIGKRIQSVRESLGESQEAFSERMGITPRFLSMVEKGEKNMSSFSLGNLCKSTSVSADYILFGIERKTDVELICDMLSNLDDEYVEHATAILRHYVLAVCPARAKAP